MSCVLLNVNCVFSAFNKVHLEKINLLHSSDKEN